MSRSTIEMTLPPPTLCTIHFGDPQYHGSLENWRVQAIQELTHTDGQGRRYFRGLPTAYLNRLKHEGFPLLNVLIDAQAPRQKSPK